MKPFSLRERGKLILKRLPGPFPLSDALRVSFPDLSLRRRSLGAALQQPVPVQKRGPVQPHHRGLPLRRGLPGLALRGAL